MRPIAQRFNLDEEAVLENVFYARAFTSDEQIAMMDHVAALFYQEPGVFKLLIVDSIMALFRVDYSGRGELADRQQHLAQVCNLLPSPSAFSKFVLSVLKFLGILKFLRHTQNILGILK